MAESARTHNASSSSSISQCNNHVFLSFRGEDTRNNFTDHLYAAFIQAGIHTFRDDDEIERGQRIATQLQNAIEEAKIAVIVLSRNYASSTWCLKELAMILERRTSVGLVVLPVFYGVDPSQVRKQTGSFAKAFSRHDSKEERDMVESWRAALTQVADLAGMALHNRSESQFIQDIVKEVQNMLHRPILNVASSLFGIDSRVEDINSWLHDESNDASIGMIYGIGGIGKTTIAKIVYNLNFMNFQGCSFLSNVRDSLKELGGLARLQRQLLSDILKGKTSDFYSIDEGSIKIKNALCCRKVLIVLDDVDEMNKLKAIIGEWEWLYPGTKVIITTRWARLLKAHEVCVKFAAKELDDNESLQLFCWHAFHQIDPFNGYEEFSRKVVHLCGGLPLALQVLGSSLSGCSTDVWRSALRKLEEIPHSEIYHVLRLSFESLDEHDQNLFLDIACFFIGKNADHSVAILDGCGYYSKIGIQNLTDRCLLALEEKKFTMHQLLRDMGREIIRQESTNEPGERSRIWHHKEALTILEEKTGTKRIRGFAFDLHKLIEENRAKANVSGNQSKRQIYQDSLNKSLSCLGIDTFENMKKLQLLQLNYVKLNGDYNKFPQKLIWLCWHGFPLTTIPNNFHLKKIVSLDMRHSDLKHVWNENVFLAELKFINLSHSHSLVTTPDFSGIPNVEKLILKDCSKLARIDESIGNLQRLALLNLKDCKNLRKLPRTIKMLKSLEQLNISGCSKLEELPKDLEKIESLQTLFADGVAIDQSLLTGRHKKIISLLPTNLWHPTFLSWLWPKLAPGFTNSSMTLPRFLAFLSLERCNISEDAFLNVPGCLPSLLMLNLSGNPLRSLPKSISSLTMLRAISLVNCTELQSIPELPINIQILDTYNCASLERIKSSSMLPELFNVLSTNCRKLVEIEGLFKLESINDIPSEIILSLGLPDSQYFGNTEVTMHNFISHAALKTPLQVLHECGIISIFIPGSELPSCYSIQSKESSISIDVPELSDHKIVGMNVCVSYTLHSSVEFLSFAPNRIKIENKTKLMRWTYRPMCLAIPEDQRKEMLWLSQWRLGEQVEVGDQLDVSVIMGPTMQVQSWGMFFAYEPIQDKLAQSNAEEMVTGLPQWFQTIILAEPDPDECFQCHHTCSSLQASIPFLDECVPMDALTGKIIRSRQSCLHCKAAGEREKKEILRDPSNNLPEVILYFRELSERINRRKIRQKITKKTMISNPYF